MGISIRTNMPGIKSNNNIKKNQKSLAKCLEKLASGFEINRSADDASGLAISEKMRFQLTSLETCIQNTEDGISLCQTADGYLEEVCDMMHRLEELTLKAANGVLEDVDQEALQSEAEQLTEEIDRISDTANFNGNLLFKGHEQVMRNADGESINTNEIPFDDFSLSCVDLGKTPLKNNTNGDMEYLCAVVTNEDSAAYGKTYNLIFGNGSTSNSSLRITYEEPVAPPAPPVVTRPTIPTPTGITDSGSCGANATWEFDANTGVLSIKGTGNTYDYVVNGCPWIQYRDSIKYVNIEDGITSIGNDFFPECTYLEKIYIPDSVTSLGDYTFSACENLKSVYIPDSVTSLGDYTFSDCRNLKSVYIPDSIASLGTTHFMNCGDLNFYFAGTQQKLNDMLANSGWTVDDLYSYIFNLTIHYNSKPPANTITKEIKLDSLNAYDFTVSGDTYSRKFDYTNDDGINMTIQQNIVVNETTHNYEISYNVINNSDKTVNTEFMYHADTAYNNNDICEGYFIDGTRITESTVYAPSDSTLTNSSTSTGVDNTIPSSISIVDVDNALPFSEKLSWDSSSNRPDAVSVGYYSQIDDWSYYNRLDSTLGKNLISSDLGISLYWNDEIKKGQNTSFDFNYGIVAVENDNNIDSNITIKKDESVVTEHKNYYPIIIETGYENYDRIVLNIGEMNSEILGINDIQITDEENIDETLKNIKSGLNNLLNIRTDIGAQQNRLEYTINNLSNTEENISAAKSRIKDTDMAKTMMEYTQINIISQASQTMLAQANTNQNSILQLLQ